MITQYGYSKDPNIVPEGIVITFGAKLIEAKGGLLPLLREFMAAMEDPEESHWMHWVQRGPALKYENGLQYVYIIISGRVSYKAYYGGFGTDPRNHIKVCGPLERAPRGLEFSGFQNFRYSTKLF